jgi:hypothetical protein
MALEAAMFERLWQAFRSKTAQTQQTEVSSRPDWAAKFSVRSESIALFSSLSPENMFRRKAQVPEAALGAAAIPIEETCQPIVGPENSVPWPLPPTPGTQLSTFWGSGKATTGTFVLRADAALRIAVNGGPFKLRIRRSDGTFLRDVAALDGEELCLGLLAIPVGGSYSLVIEAPADVQWGVTVVQQWHPMSD